jgi:hypothetical protein
MKASQKKQYSERVSKRMKEYWKEAQSCSYYKNGKKVHKRVCYDCRECLSDGKPLYSEIYDPLFTY